MQIGFDRNLFAVRIDHRLRMQRFGVLAFRYFETEMLNSNNFLSR